MSFLNDLKVQTLAGEKCDEETLSKMKRNEESGQEKIHSEDRVADKKKAISI